MVNTIDEYIAAAPTEAQPMLHCLRQSIAKAAPEATEKISWGMATFYFHGNLVHFSAEKKHIGFHPAPTAIEAFRDELAEYHCSKGTVRFPYELPLPLELIEQMVRFRVTEQQALALEKQSRPKKQQPPRPLMPLSFEVAQALEERGLSLAFDARPPYQQNGYLKWITEAKRPETQEKRLQQMLDELLSGDTYLGKPYKSKSKNTPSL